MARQGRCSSIGSANTSAPRIMLYVVPSGEWAHEIVCNASHAMSQLVPALQAARRHSNLHCSSIPVTTAVWFGNRCDRTTAAGGGTTHVGVSPQYARTAFAMLGISGRVRCRHGRQVRQLRGIGVQIWFNATNHRTSEQLFKHPYGPTSGRRGNNHSHAVVQFTFMRQEARRGPEPRI